MANNFDKIPYNSGTPSKVLWVEILLLALIFIFGFGMISIGAWYCYPNVEDLELSCAPRDLGMLRSVLDLMILYDGRYSTNLLHAVNPLVLNWINGYKIMPVIAVGLFSLSLTYFLKVVISSKSKYQLYVLSLLLTLIFIGSILYLPDALYDMGGCFVYIYPCIFFLLFAGSLIRYVKMSVQGNRLLFLLTGLVLIIGLGFNEMFLALYGILLSGLLLYYWFSERLIFFQILPVAMIGFSSMLFFVASPGVSVRLNDSERTITSLVFYNNLKNLIVTVINLVKRPVFFCSLIYICILFRQGLYSLKFTITPKKAAFVMLIVLAVCYLMCVVYYVPKEDCYGYPVRIYPPILFILIVSIFILIGSTFKLPAFLSRSNIALQYVKPILLLIILLNSIWGSNGISFLFDDFKSMKMQKLKAVYDKRVNVMISAHKNTTAHKACTVEKLNENDYPHTIYSYPDLETNRNTSIWNKYHEEYFRLDDVTVKGDTTRRFR